MARTLLIVSVLLFAACTSSSSGGPPAPFAFPKGFLWGTATAGFQVDMGCPTLAPEQCEDRNSDWYAFVNSPRIRNNALLHQVSQDVSVGPGFWELYPQDFDRIKNELYNNSFRMGFEWSRIFPAATDALSGYDALKAAADADAVQHYHDMLKALKARGIKPLVTLNHYSLPLWIHEPIACNQNLNTCPAKGWVDRERTVREIAKYAGFAAREFGAEIDLWVTLNEPLAVLLPGYLAPSANRSNPPGLFFREVEAKQVMIGLIEAHARMYDAVKANDTVDADGDGKATFIGVVYPIAPAVPKNPDSERDRKGAENLDYIYNRVFLNATALGLFDEELDGDPVLRDDLANRMDYIGLNFYFRAIVEGSDVPTLRRMSPLSTFNLTTLAFEEYPPAIIDALHVVRDVYKKPILITENGTPVPKGVGLDGDVDPAFEQDTEAPPAKHQSDFLARHLQYIWRGIQDGCDIRGYYFWSLVDNYEWNHGMDMKFGLYAVDPADPAKKRVRRPAGEMYARIARENRIPADVLAEFPTSAAAGLR